MADRLVPPDGWIDTESAAQRLRVSQKTIQRYRDAKKIVAKQIDGSWFHDPASLDLLDGPEDDTQAVQVLTRALKEAHDHGHRCNERIFSFCELLSKDHTAMQGRIESLQKFQDDQRALVDKMQSDELARDILRREHEAKMARAARAFAKLEEYAPTLLDALAFKFAPGSRAVQEKHLAGILEELPEEALAALKMSGYLTDKQIASMLEIKRKLAEQREKIAASNAKDAAP